MTFIILLYLSITLVAVILNSLTTYHFFRYRYEGDSSKIIVIFFVFVLIFLMALPFYFFDYSMQDQSILEKLLR